MRLSAPLRLTIYAALATIGSAISLMSVFSNADWLVPVIGAVLLVAGACALVRWSPLPSAFEPFTAAVAVLLWLTFLYARKWSHFGFIPGRTALRHLGHLARHGFTDIHKLPTPVPTHDGLVLLSVIGVAAVALLVDLMAVTLRRAALAGLPLLALFTLCAATGRDGVNTFAFLGAACGYLLLLYIDNRERVTRWGAAVGSGSRARPAPTWSTDASSAPAPATLGRRVGAAAIGVSVVVPLLVPGLHGGIEHHHDGDGIGTGGGNVHTFDPIVFVGNALGAQINKPVLNYSTTTTNPGYLRLTSLDTYHAGSFSAAELRAPQTARVSNGLAGVIPPSSTTYQSRVTFNTGYQFRWLPVPQTATGVKIDGDWRFDPQTATIFSASTTTSGSHYSVDSSPNRPTPNELAEDPSGVGADQAIDLLVPGVSTRVKNLTKQITDHAHSDYDAALDIQRYLTSSRFTYDPTIAADTGKDPLGDFLFTTQTGFCQQFATAMAVMARIAGIPSRVAVGFTAGTKKPDGTYQVTTHDAHAWPELWFPKYGWLPFEPTPRRDGQAQTPAYARVRPNSAGGTANPGPKVTQSPEPSGVKGGLPKKGFGKDGGDIGAGSGGTSATDLALLVVLLAVAVGLLLIAIPALIRVATRRRRWRRLRDDPNLVAEAWAELRDSAADVGAPWDEAGTPRTLAAALVTWAAPADIAAPMSRLTRAEEQDRYAATPAPVASDLRADIEAVRAALTRDKSRARRLLILLLPSSTMRVLRAKVSRLADAVDYLERAPGRALTKFRTTASPT